MIHIVVGMTGRYEDAMDWNVMAYWTKPEAEAHAERANNWCRQNHVLYTAEGFVHNYYTTRDKLKGANPYDEGFRLDYTGTRYIVESVPSRGLTRA